MFITKVTSVHGFCVLSVLAHKWFDIQGVQLEISINGFETFREMTYFSVHYCQNVEFLLNFLKS